MAELSEWCAIPSVSSDPERAGDVRRSAEHLAGLMEAAGLDTEVLATDGGQQVADGRDLEVDLALVVGGATGVQAAVAHGRLERWGGPLLQRVGRLHVVVAVDESGRCIGPGVQPVGVHGGGAGRLEDLGVLQPGVGQEPGAVLGARPHVGGVGRVGADRRDAQPAEQAIGDRLPLLLHPVRQPENHGGTKVALATVDLVAGEFDEIRGRLEAISEELADLAIVRLRESIDAGGTELPVDEKRLTRARRAVEKAISILREPDDSD